VLLTVRRDGHALVWQTRTAGLEGIQAIHMGWDAYTASNVGAPSNYRTLQRQKRGFPTSGTSASEVGVFGMDGTAPQRVIRLAPLATLGMHSVLRPTTYHNALRQVGLCKDDGAHVSQHGDQNAVLLGRFESSANIAQGTVISLDVELVFESHWHPVERPHQSAILFKEGIELLGSVKRIVKKNLGQAVSVSKGG
jgi:hypothetical protein